MALENDLLALIHRTRRGRIEWTLMWDHHRDLPLENYQGIDAKEGCRYTLGPGGPLVPADLGDSGPVLDVSDYDPEHRGPPQGADELLIWHYLESTTSRQRLRRLLDEVREVVRPSVPAWVKLP